MVNIVVPHDAGWKAAFASESSAIRARLVGIEIDLHHIGSTAIAGILAKPIIDLLGVVPDLAALDTKGDALAGLGYEALGAFGIEGRQYFRKVDGAGQRTHHLHVYETGSPHVERHLAFRDYLVAHPGKAKAYSDLKAKLTSPPGATWDGYLDGKAPFVVATEKEALRWYRSL